MIIGANGKPAGWTWGCATLDHCHSYQVEWISLVPEHCANALDSDWSVNSSLLAWGAVLSRWCQVSVSFRCLHILLYVHPFPLSMRSVLIFCSFFACHRVWDVNGCKIMMLMINCAIICLLSHLLSFFVCYGCLLLSLCCLRSWFFVFCLLWRIHANTCLPVVHVVLLCVFFLSFFSVFLCNMLLLLLVPARECHIRDWQNEWMWWRTKEHEHT